MSKKWLLGACGALLAGGLAASTAQAGLAISLRINGIADPGTTISFKTVAAWNLLHSFEIGQAGLSQASNLYAPVLAEGQRVRFDIVATVTGADENLENESIGNVAGNLIASVAGGSTRGASTGGSFLAAGQLGGFGVSPFTGNGSAVGSQVDIDGDGNMDRGSKVFTDVFDPYLNMVGGVAPPPVMANAAGVKIGAGTFIVGSVQPGGQTAINFDFWKDPASGNPYFKSAVWFEDIDWDNYDPGAPDVVLGPAAKSPNGQNFSIGAPIVLQSVVPEPAALSVLALGALGLLARRRK